MRPHTIAMAVASANGIIARSHDDPVNWTSAHDRKRFKEVTLGAGALIMGRKTFESIGRPLPGRLNVIMTRSPQNCPDRHNLLFTSMQPGEILDALYQKGYFRVVIAGGAAVFSEFLNQRLVDEIQLTITPAVFTSGVSLAPYLEQSVSVRLTEVIRLSANELVLRYRLDVRK